MACGIGEGTTGAATKMESTGPSSTEAHTLSRGSPWWSNPLKSRPADGDQRHSEIPALTRWIYCGPAVSGFLRFLGVDCHSAMHGHKLTDTLFVHVSERQKKVLSFKDILFLMCDFEYIWKSTKKYHGLYIAVCLYIHGQFMSSWANTHSEKYTMSGRVESLVEWQVPLFQVSGEELIFWQY